ncbi:MAG: phosphoenolpyruvate synthase [Deltaproteobacteria bacterium]|nr:phosphoenolpyruvate synthase [Deltaproteobacteria bacterium]
MIFRLSADTPERIEVLGGKGCGLVRLLRAGLAVPDVWCVPADAYREPAKGVEDTLAESLAALWEELSVRLPGSCFAVRSSATTEDLEGASAAGVYRTVLGVTSLEGLVGAVGDCRAALHTEGARAYRDRHGQSGTPAIAILIQRMLWPEVAGVMLTANPRRAFAREIVIDASWGLGEAVVSGKTEPDHVVLDRETGAVREMRVGTKAVETVFVPGEGIADRAVDPERRSAAVVDESRRIALFELAQEVTRKIGPRQDVEWAFEDGQLYALQVRPITGLPPERPANVWTRKFGDEYLADYSLPLSRDLLLKWIAEDYMADMLRLMGRTDLSGMVLLREHQGYSYLSGLFVAAVMEGIPPAMRTGDLLDWFTPLWSERLRALPFKPRHALGPFVALARDKRAPIGRNVEALRRHCEAIDREIVPLLAQDLTKLDDAAWRGQLERADAFGSEHFHVIRWGMGFHNPFLHATLASRLRAWCADADGGLYASVISGLADTRTQEINRDVWRLGRLAREDAELRGAILAGEAYDAIRARTSSSKVWERFDDFISRHGHRSAAREISQPCWREDPEVVLASVRAQLRGDRAPEDPATREAEAVARRDTAVRRALAAVGRGPGGLVRRRVLRWLIHNVQIYTRYREDQRYHFDYLLQHLRNLLLEQGRRFTEAGILDAADDIFFLDGETMWSLVGDPRPRPALGETIAERRAHYAIWKDRRPATYLFDDVETEGEIAEGDPDPNAGGADSVGYGASRGRARAAVRVVRDLHDLGNTEPGEILVAANIDPGWTHVFPMLAGLITETGGVLSHGALLAREYGIPAVMGISGATERFQTGETVEIDGSSGSVERIAEQDRQPGLHNAP